MREVARCSRQLGEGVLLLTALCAWPVAEGTWQSIRLAAFVLGLTGTP
jgi:hypothetical protein